MGGHGLVAVPDGLTEAVVPGERLCVDSAELINSPPKDTLSSCSTLTNAYMPSVLLIIIRKVLSPRRTCLSNIALLAGIKDRKALRCGIPLTMTNVRYDLYHHRQSH